MIMNMWHQNTDGDKPTVNNQRRSTKCGSDMESKINDKRELIVFDHKKTILNK
jgi:hypothetical protein